MFIGAYWNARQESLEQTAKRISAYLQALANISNYFSTWFKKGWTKRAARKELIQILPEIVASLLKTNNRDSDGSPIVELGYSLGIWNGNHVFPCSLDFNCGAFSNVVKNCVVLQFPSEGNVLSILSAAQIMQALMELITTFDPEVAVFTSDEYMDRYGGGSPCEAGGWIVYKRSDGIEKIQIDDPIGVL